MTRTTLTIGSPRHSGLADRRPRRPAEPWLVRLFDTVMLWAERRRERRMLAGASDHTLADLGLSRTDVEQEVAKPFWR